MVGKSGNRGVSLGRTRLPSLPVPGELFAVYQPVLGHLATFLWLNIRWAAHTEGAFPLDDLPAFGVDVEAGEVQRALEKLAAYDLVEVDGDGNLTVHDPVSQDVFDQRFCVGSAPKTREGEVNARLNLRAVPSGTGQTAWSGETEEKRPPASQPSLPLPPARRQFDQFFKADGEGTISTTRDIDASPAATRVASDEKEASSAEPVLRSPLSKRRKAARMLKLVESTDGAETPDNPDMQAVVQIYHKRIGMIGPTQYEKLRFWVEERGMEGAVVALAIEETVQSAEVPRISYLEGILRNWYNDDIRSLTDIHDRKRASKVLFGNSQGGESESGMREGVPNASAYRSVSADLVAKWKELYPDEYDR